MAQAQPDVRPSSIPKLNTYINGLDGAANDYAFEYAWVWLNGGRAPNPASYELTHEAATAIRVQVQTLAPGPKGRG